MPSILFVCTANICRSPMAVALFLARLQQTQLEWRSWKVESAGTWADFDQPACLEAQQTMARRGLDISFHRSREVNPFLLEQFNLILTMEKGQKEALRFEFPKVADRIFMLSEMTGTEVNVRDPIGEPINVFEAVADQIDSLLIRGMERIIKLSNS